MDHLDENAHVTVIPPNKEKIKKLWTVAGILGIVTAVEFVIAFTMPHGPPKTFHLCCFDDCKSRLHRVGVYALEIRSESIVLVNSNTHDFCGLDAGGICLRRHGNFCGAINLFPNIIRGLGDDLSLFFYRSGA